MGPLGRETGRNGIRERDGDDAEVENQSRQGILARFVWAATARLTVFQEPGSRPVGACGKKIEAPTVAPSRSRTGLPTASSVL
jgi:hypothetical protein